MSISDSEFRRVKTELEKEGVMFDAGSLRDQDGVLWMRIFGDYKAGQEAVRVLHKAGINQVIDNDYATNENAVIWAKGAGVCTVWIDYVDDEPLFRI